MNLRDMIYQILNTSELCDTTGKIESPEAILEDGRKVLNLYLNGENKLVIQSEVKK